MPASIEDVNRMCKSVVTQLHRFRSSHGEAAFAGALEAWKGISARDVMQAVTGSDGGLDALAQLEAMAAFQLEHEYALEPVVMMAAESLLFNAVSEVFYRHTPPR